MPQTLWIVVANGSRARLFERTRHDAPLTVLKDWVHPATREHRQDMVGKHRQSGMRGRSGLAERSPFHDRERGSFAAEICDWLTHAVQAHEVEHIALLASNPFLGELVAHGQGHLARHLCGTHAVDLTSLPVDQLGQRLKQTYRL